MASTLILGLLKAGRSPQEKLYSTQLYDRSIRPNVTNKASEPTERRR
jgi:hypothetical protein